jgi:tRNA (cmo5U34)-methyltransferase
MARDQIYQRSDKRGQPFRFDADVAAVFDDMARRSIPFYETLHSLAVAIIARQQTSPLEVVDLGCSTGRFLCKLAAAIPAEAAHFTGLDKSPEMIARARQRARTYSASQPVRFVEADVIGYPFAPTRVFCAFYTLQFIPPAQRETFLRQLHTGLRPDGILILAEKTQPSDGHNANLFNDLYVDFKESKGYSQLEIAAKREALENVLIPSRDDELIPLLKSAGFHRCETFFQYLSFRAIIAHARA